MAKKTYRAELKAKVAIEALKGHKTTNELASEGFFRISSSNWQWFMFSTQIENLLITKDSDS